MKKKLLAAVLGTAAAFCAAFGLSACGDGNDNKGNSDEWGSEYSVQSAYAVAQNLGYTGSLEEFIATISGKDGADGKDGTDGKDGVGIDDAYIDEEGCLILVLTDKKTINCGKVSVSNVEKQNFQYATIKENNQTVGYSIIGINTGTVVDTDLIIPSSYQGIPVTKINDEAFKGCKLFTNVTIPDSIISIGNSAFSGCGGLTSITIPDGVTSIGDSAFSGCSSLASVTIGKRVTSIGDSAFSSCSSLASVTIGKGVTSIGNSAFSNCRSLTSLIIPDSVTSIGSFVFYKCNGLTSITIPDSVTSIGNSAFSGCSSLASVTIGKGVTSISNSAFDDCSSLASVTIGIGVTSIGNSAFDDCSSLRNVYYKGDIASWCGIDGLDYLMSSDKTIYINGKEITGELIFPDSVTSIGNSAFRNCIGLTSVVIPDSVTSIGISAFRNCIGLTSVVIPDSVTSIGNGAFSNCIGLTSVVIPDSVTSIGNGAFYDCDGLEIATLPLSALNHITKTSIKTLVITSGDNIKDLAFRGFNNLVNVTINGVTSIGSRIFNSCINLKSITISDSVTVIDDNAFYDCDNIENATIPAFALSYIPKTKLKKIVIISGIVKSYMFAGCNVLESLTILDSVTYVNPDALGGCNNIEKLTIPANIEKLTIPNTVSFHIPRDKLKTVVFISGDIISDYLLNSCEVLTDIFISDSVTSIGNYAFTYCSSLKNINYKGTKEQWKSISKGISWDDMTGEYVVHCTDGDIAKGEE